MVEMVIWLDLNHPIESVQGVPEVIHVEGDRPGVDQGVCRVGIMLQGHDAIG